jgi:Protein of unknown function (DUF1552)
MKAVRIDRRQVLRGSGGITLALPFLPSLYPRRADGAELVPGLKPCFAAMTTVHGAVLEQNMYPAASTLTQSTVHLPGHNIKSGPLQGTTLSPVLKSASLTPKLVAKLNVLRGFDFPYYIGHHNGGHLGNYVRSDQGPKNMAEFATIDQIMANSASFYPDLGRVKLRAMVTGRGGFGGAPSFTYANPQAKTGAVNNIQPSSDAAGMFRNLFSGATSTPVPVVSRKPIVDRVLQSYRDLAKGNRRISVDDKSRLDAHVSHLAELERRLKVSQPSSAQCGNLKAPGGDYQGMNDVIAFAFACGTSRVATISLPAGTYGNHSGNWHQDVAHNAGSNQPKLTECLQRSFDLVFVDLMKKLEALEVAPGVTALDLSLVQWTQEAGWNTHDAQDMAIVTAGSANGFFKTGLFVDYRSTKKMKMFGSYQQQMLGLMHRQWLATALQAMGVPPSEFEKNGKAGYGDPLMSADFLAAVPAQIHQNASQPVPIIT